MQRCGHDMRHFAAFTLAIILASAALTTGAFTTAPAEGHAMGDHGSMQCESTGCATSPSAHDMPSVDCIARCLSASAPANSETSPTVIAVVLAFIAALAGCRMIAQSLASPGATDAIGTFMRKMAFATVMLRN